MSGNTALVGSYGSTGNAGAVYVYSRNGGRWVAQTRWIAADSEPDDSFGLGVALSRDASTALVGAPGKARLTGAAYPYTR